jgi:hypothetical protein
MVTIDGIIYDRLDTTANWQYVNPVLGNKEKGFEVDANGYPIGMKIGNGILQWDDLVYWFVFKPIRLTFAAGVANPIVINALTDYPQYGNTPKVRVMLDLGGDQEQERYDMPPKIDMPSGVLNTLTFDNGGGATTIDNLIIYIG